MLNNRTLLITLMTVVFFVLPALSFAQASEQKSAGPQSVLMERFDINGDGVIGMDEFTGPVEHFNKLDKNADGVLSVDELPSPKAPVIRPEESGRQQGRGLGMGAGKGPGKGQPPQGGGFDKDDVNNDGKVSRSEFSGPEDMFTKLDTDGDGYITREEIEKNMGGDGQGRPPMRK